MRLWFTVFVLILPVVLTLPTQALSGIPDVAEDVVQDVAQGVVEDFRKSINSAIIPFFQSITEVRSFSIITYSIACSCPNAFRVHTSCTGTLKGPPGCMS